MLNMDLITKCEGLNTVLQNLVLFSYFGCAKFLNFVITHMLSLVRPWVQEFSGIDNSKGKKQQKGLQIFK